MNQKTKKLVVSALMLALSFVLSLIKIYELPWGGSVTLFSMLPIILVGYMYGNTWGILMAFTSLFANAHGCHCIAGLCRT